MFDFYSSDHHHDGYVFRGKRDIFEVENPKVTIKNQKRYLFLRFISLDWSQMKAVDRNF